MTTVDARYLLEIKEAMMAGLRTPGHSSATRQRLVYGHRLLARFLVREQVEGTLRSRADARFAEFGGRLAAPGAPPGTLTQAAWTQSRGALQEVAEIELECCKTVLRAIEEATAEPPPGDAGPGALTAAETAALTRFLRTAFREEADISAGASRTVPGGFSKQTLFVELQHARQLPATVVLRMDRPDAVVVSTVMDEYQILRQLHEAGVAVPQPFALEAAGNVLRGRFIVMSKIEGHNPGDAMDVTEADPDLACDLARVLARIHRIPAENFGPGVTGARQSTQERLLADIARAQANWAAIDLQSPSLDIALSWLRNHAGAVAGRGHAPERQAGEVFFFHQLWIGTGFCSPGREGRIRTGGRAGGTWIDGNHADPIRPQLFRQRLGKMQGRRIQATHDIFRRRPTAAAARNVHNPSGAIGAHMRNDLPAGADIAERLDRHAADPLRVRHLIERPDRRTSGVVNENIDPAQFFQGRADAARNTLRRRQVRGNRKHSDAKAAQGRGGLFHRRAIPGDHRDVSAFLSQNGSDIQPDTPACPGDDAGFSFNAEFHQASFVAFPGKSKPPPVTHAPLPPPARASWFLDSALPPPGSVRCRPSSQPSKFPAPDQANELDLYSVSRAQKSIFR